jgi:carbon-monoxide dehydrogenase medium subunit
MSPFELAAPSSIAEAIALLEEEGARPLSGGTALMLMMKAGVLRPAAPGFAAQPRARQIEADGSLRIGAMTTLSALERSPEVRKGWPAIARTLRTLSNVRVRNVATVGGALGARRSAHGPAAAAGALGAKVFVSENPGERSMPVEDLYAGYLETTLRNELITQVEVPPSASAARRTSSAPRARPTTGPPWA